jgi:hypothetical protein
MATATPYRAASFSQETLTEHAGLSVRAISDMDRFRLCTVNHLPPDAAHISQ